MTLRQYIESFNLPSLLTWGQVLDADIAPTYKKHGKGYFCNEVKKLGYKVEQSSVTNNLRVWTEGGKQKQSEEFIPNTPDLILQYLEANPDAAALEIKNHKLQPIYQINPYALKSILKKRHNITATIRFRQDRIRVEFHEPTIDAKG